MEIDIGISECDKNVDNYYGRNIGSHTAPAEMLSTVSSPFMVSFLHRSSLCGYFHFFLLRNFSKMSKCTPTIISYSRVRIL